MLLKPANKQTAYLKAGALGFAGSGKTFTASEIAIGLAKLTGKKQVAFFDTETGSDFVADKFKREGLDLMVAKTRAFVDLLGVVKEAEATGECAVLIIDSISHVWTELTDSYLNKKNKDRLSLWDWAPIKSQWRDFTDAYLCSKLHIILCGRAAFTYDEWMNEKGEKEIMKTGTKMRVETDFGFEPSLLFEMERIQSETNVKKKRGSQWIHRCTILKDRSDLLNGAVFDNPKFADFLPIIKSLNLGGEHFVIDTSRNSDELIQNPDYSYEDKRKFQAIFTEEIEGELVSSFPGQSTVEKKMKADILQVVFDSRSWSKIKEFPPEVLRKGVASVKQLCEIVKNTGELPEGDMVAWLRGEFLRGASLDSMDADDDVPAFKTPAQEKLEV